MERMTFLKFIQEKNDKVEARKLSLQSISTENRQKTENGVFKVDNPAFRSQLPPFINRKVKNLKPYTNHFKRLNIQTTKSSDSPHKNGQLNRLDPNGTSCEKIKSAKSNLLKQLGICNQIQPIINPSLKASQISVYEQFLEKTTTIFISNAIDTIYKNCLKKSVNNIKPLKQDYEISQRQILTHFQQQGGSIHQRRSLGSSLIKQLGDNLNLLSKKSKKIIQSTNQLPKKKAGQSMLKCQKVCIVTNNIKFDQNQKLHEQKIIKKEISFNKKSVLQLTEHNRQQIYSQNQLKSQKSQTLKQDIYKTKMTDRILTCPTKNPGIIQHQEQSFRQLDRSTKQNFSIKQSPNKKFVNKTGHHFAVNVKLKQDPKTPMRKSQNREEGTINVDKSKSKILLPETPLPNNITAYSYIVYEPSFSQNKNCKYGQQNLKNKNKLFGNNRILASLNCKTVVEIASLTKIMTFILALQICDKLKINSSTEKVRIGKYEESINGTSAEIKQGDIYTVEQLFYGLMLPSGNDASLALAIWGGKKMLIGELKQKQKQKKKTNSDNLSFKNLNDLQLNEGVMPDLKKIVLKKKKCYERFILEMNKKARALGMTKTTYANSHGLSNNLNKSCAFDLCILCQFAMLNDNFKKVVSTKDYRCKIQYEQLTKDFSTKQVANSRHLKMQEYENNTSEQPIDDIEHDNEHSDEQSTESIEQKQYSHYSNSERQDRFSLSQPNFNTIKESQLTRALIVYGEREVFWQNTHKLLARQQYIGIKTGITNTAGPCLASCIKTQQNRFFIIIVLSSKKINYRFKDTETLRKWIYKKEKLEPKKKQFENPNQQENTQEIQKNFPERE